MSMLDNAKNALQRHIARATQAALHLRRDFAHPVGGENTPEAQDAELSALVQQELAHDDANTLPHTDDWGEGFNTTTYIDPTSQLLTTQTQGIAPLDMGSSIYDIYADRAQRMGDKPLYTYQEGGEWVTKTANEFLDDVRAVAKGLMSQGLAKGDAVAFMCSTSYEWNVTDAAVMACGGVLATIYDTDSADQIRYIVNNADAKLLIVQTNDMRLKADGALNDCPSLQRIMCLATGALDELTAYGVTVSDEALDERIDSVQKTDICSIVYTSGSTAAPKGVEMTHEDYCTTAYNLPAFMPQILNNNANTVLLFLPQAHSFARAVNYIVVASCLHIYIARGIASLITDLQVAKPTIMIVVPRVLEKVYNAASQKAGHGPRGVVFAAAVVAAQRYMQEISTRGKASTLASLRRAAYDPLVYQPLREVLGGRAQWIVAGGAPLDPQLLAFFRGAQVPVYEGYGLTETTAPCAFNPPSTPFREGSVGIAFPGFSVRIAADDEIQVMGTAVFQRYHKNPQVTEESFTPDGWYATGDLGRLDHEGFLYITGRKKDLIITAGGKNVTPGPIEEVIQRCEIVSQALVLGDKRPFISALVTLDPDTLPSWLERKGLDPAMSMEQVAHNAVVRAEVQRFIDIANDGVSRAESVRKFIILPEEFTQENGLMTASMKVIRPRVIKRYATLLNTQMYTAAR